MKVTSFVNTVFALDQSQFLDPPRRSTASSSTQTEAASGAKIAVAQQKQDGPSSESLLRCVKHLELALAKTREPLPKNPFKGSHFSTCASENASGRGFSAQPKFCSYCRKQGHTREECYHLRHDDGNDDSGQRSGRRGGHPWRGHGRASYRGRSVCMVNANQSQTVQEPAAGQAVDSAQPAALQFRHDLTPVFLLNDALVQDWAKPVTEATGLGGPGTLSGTSSSDKLVSI